MTDEALVAAYQKGEFSVLEEICNRYKNLVAYKARCMYVLGGDTQDLIQEGMIGLIGAVNSFNPEKNDSFRPFASMCVSRYIYKAIESAGRKKNSPLNDYVPIVNDDGEEDIAHSLGYSEAGNPEARVLEEERAVSIENAIRESLSAFEIMVFEQCLKGLSYVDIATKLDKSPKTIDNAIQRIRKKARIAIENLD